MIISKKQIEQINSPRYDAFIEKMLVHFKKLKPKYLPADDASIKKYLHKKVQDNKKWKLKTDAQLEQYLFFCLSYQIMNEKEYPEFVVDCLTWPQRMPDDKLKHLHKELMNRSFQEMEKAK